MARSTLTADQVQQYHKDGFLIVRGMLSHDTVALVERTANEDRAVDQRAGTDGSKSGAARLSIWFDPSDTIYGAVARSASIVDGAETLLGDEAYHFQSNMAFKEARVGAASSWHQDYASCTATASSSPDLTVAFIAVDPATRENGCLQMIKGSQRLGRIDHNMSGKQPAADSDRVADVLKRLPLVYVTMDAGDVVYFHANTLHRSDRNNSDRPRWSMLCYYNAKSNTPNKEIDHWQYRPLVKLPDEAIADAASERFATPPQVPSSESIQ